VKADHSLNKLKEFKQTSARKLMETAFLDRIGELMVEFMQIYAKTLHRAIQNKRHQMLTSIVVFLDDNEQPYTDVCTRATPTCLPT
jgi:hypothetical protein